MKRLIATLILTIACVLPLGAGAVSVAPAVMELSGARGQTVSGRVAVMNTGDAEDTFYLSTLKFEPRDDSGSPNFIPSDIDHSGLAEWIVLPSASVNVPARSRAEVEFRIEIPNDVPSGGYYAAIVVSDAPSEVVAANGASIMARVASLILLTVEGETEEKIGFLDFTSSSAGSWSDVPAGMFAYRLQNQGNVHVTPAGVVSVRDLFGRVVVVVDANPDEGRILPGMTRRYEGSFGAESQGGFWNRVASQWSQFAIGPVTAELEVSYAQTVSPIRASFRFWIVPVHLLSFAGGAALFLILVGTVLSKRRR